MGHVWVDPLEIGVTAFSKLRDRTPEQKNILPNDGRRHISHLMDNILKTAVSRKSVDQAGADPVVKAMLDLVRQNRIPTAEVYQPKDLRNREAENVGDYDSTDEGMSDVSAPEAGAGLNRFRQCSVRALFAGMKRAAWQELKELWKKYDIEVPTQDGPQADKAFIKFAVRHACMGNQGQDMGDMFTRPGACA